MKRSPLRRVALARNRRKRQDVEFSVSVREEVRARAGWRCERCRVAWEAHIHHRLPRSQGGKGTADNALAVCAPCHAWIHANPYQSCLSGWLLHRGIPMPADFITCRRCHQPVDYLTEQAVCPECWTEIEDDDRDDR